MGPGGPQGGGVFHRTGAAIEKALFIVTTSLAALTGGASSRASLANQSTQEDWERDPIRDAGFAC